MALTDEQIAQEEKFLAGMPRFNIAAFLFAAGMGSCAWHVGCHRVLPDVACFR